MRTSLARYGVERRISEGASVAVIVPFYGERFLMVRRGKGWEFPGGKVERGETAEDAARRELTEETGVRPPKLRYVGRAKPDRRCALYTCEIGEPPTEGALFARMPKTLSFPRAEGVAFLGAAWRCRSDYDEIAPYFDEVRGLGKTSTDVWSAKVWELLGKPRGKLVADIGCGTGRYSYFMAGKGARVIGLDNSKGMLARAQGKGCRGEASWVKGDAQSLPIAGRKFDCALMFLVLQHLPDWRGALADCARAIRPGGKFVVVTTARQRIRSHIIRHFPGAVSIDLGRFPGIPEIEGALRSSGFEGVGHEKVLVRRGCVPVKEMVARFASKHISTLALVPEREFEGRLAKFEANLRRACGNSVPDDTELTFVHACARA